jgi:photosystem II stability/assembly factor-like uncharacterized protein
VLFINSQTGFAAGLSGNIFKTTDLGKTWTQAANTSEVIFTIFASQMEIPDMLLARRK